MSRPHLNFEVGQRFGRLVVMAITSERRRGAVLWRCRCDCGIDVLAGSSDLHSGDVSSCGCLRHERSTVHGQSRTAEYRIHATMMRRCYVHSDPAYANYGGRGISVDCSLHVFDDFLIFLTRLGTRPQGYTLERIDNDGHYAPGNLRWATRRDQALNRRSNHVLTFDGRTKTLTEWADEYGLPPTTLRRRLQLGWAVDAALTAPLRQHRPYQRASRTK